jgi:hypothetical protein
MAWLIFIAPVGAFVVQSLCLALAVYLDEGPQPIFPRWVAYFSVLTAVAMTPAVCAVIFKSGPLAWDGAISFWLRIGAFTLYIAVMFFVVRAAISRQAAQKAVKIEPTVGITDAKVTQ